jgi:hypothetical protein
VLIERSHLRTCQSFLEQVKVQSLGRFRMWDGLGSYRCRNSRWRSQALMKDEQTCRSKQHCDADQSKQLRLATSFGPAVAINSGPPFGVIS